MESQEERKGGCPCEHTTPCQPDCSCVNPYMSCGCLRCCSYGSDEQQKAMAEYLVAKEKATNFDEAYEEGYNAGQASCEPELADCKSVEAELRAEIGRLRSELVEIYALKVRMANSFGKLGHSYEKKCDENKRMRNALEACGISRDNPDTCAMCGLHFADCEDDRLADEVNGEFIDIGPACPGAWARSALGIKQNKKDTELTWELCRHDILRRKCIECSKDNL